MPVRYTRKLQPPLVDYEMLKVNAEALSAYIIESARTVMPEMSGWSVDDRSHADVLEFEYCYGDFKGAVYLRPLYCKFVYN